MTARTWTPTVFVGYAVHDASAPPCQRAAPMLAGGADVPPPSLARHGGGGPWEPRLTRAQTEQGIALGICGAIIGRVVFSSFLGMVIGGAAGFAAPWAFDKLESMP